MDTTLKDKKWGKFYLKDIFSSIQRGKRLKKGDHIAGNIPYVSSTSNNNGIDGFLGNAKNVRVFSNCCTIANSGSVGTCFYHPTTFVASDHVTQLKNEKFNRYIYLFISTVASRLSEKYSFNREMNDNRIRREVIMLPMNENGDPDYVFMEQYMRFLENKSISTYKATILKHIEESSFTNIIPPLNDKVWSEFKIEKLFNIQAGKSKGLNHLKQNKSGISYLGATNNNNGVLTTVDRVDSMVQRGNCIAFIRNGEGSMGFSIYKKEDFIATSDITVGYNENLNPYIGMFITTIADKVRGKYNFGYKRSDGRLKKETLQLPVNEEGEPDYKYMEQYMKQIKIDILTRYLTFINNRK